MYNFSYGSFRRFFLGAAAEGRAGPKSSSDEVSVMTVSYYS